MKLQKDDYIQLSGDLFTAVQSGNFFSDSKTFVDSIPKKKPAEIKREFQQFKKSKSFNLKDFILDRFNLPEEEQITLDLPDDRTMEEHIELLWKYLERSAVKKVNDYSSLIPLPNSYIIPGGRFREIYYWDTFFTMQGLLACGMLTSQNICLIILFI